MIVEVLHEEHAALLVHRHRAGRERDVAVLGTWSVLPCGEIEQGVEPSLQ